MLSDARAGDASSLGAGVSSQVGSLVRVVLVGRLVALLLTVISLPRMEGRLLGVSVVVMAGGLASLVPLRWWDRFSPTLLRHPLYLAGDLLLGMGLLALIGLDSPFFYFTLATAVLAGVLYGVTGAAVFSVLLIAAYAVSLLLVGTTEASSFAVTVGNPALYPLAAAAGAAVRRVLDDQAETELALRNATRSAAVESERARIARDMHDSLAKTLHGMSLSASALTKWVERDPERAASDAAALAEAARDAAAETRTIIRDLRDDALELPLAESVASYVEGFSERTGISVAAEATGGEAASSTTRWELFSVLREALANVEEHAGAGHVRILLEDHEEDLVLSVRDDGRGFDVPARPQSASPNGHFGIIGMLERVDKVGGSLELRSAPGEGTTVRARVPSRLDAAAEGAEMAPTR
jgi:signal transduction histidine kinase